MCDLKPMQFFKNALDPAGIGINKGQGKKPAAPPPPAPPPTSADPAIADAQNKARQAEKRRKGRAATMLTDQDSLGEPSLARPSAGAKLLGD